VPQPTAPPHTPIINYVFGKIKHYAIKKLGEVEVNVRALLAPETAAVGSSRYDHERTHGAQRIGEWMGPRVDIMLGHEKRFWPVSVF
jgi:hypothetical protein